MLDPKLVRTQYEDVKKYLEKRKYPLEHLEKYRDLDIKWREALQVVEDLRHKQKQLTPKGKPSAEQLKELSKLSVEIKQKHNALQETESELHKAALNIPNILAADVPFGESAENNLEIRAWGSPKEFNFTPKAHDQLAEALNLVDFNRGAKITGTRFSVFTGLGARLERALMNFMLDLHTKEHAYQECLPPAMVNTDSLIGTGQLPKFAEDQFRIDETNLWLSPTAEVQLTNLYRNEILEERDLPLKLTAYTPCFRKEAGSYGQDVKGLIRQHQFDKVELVKLVKPERSEQELEALLKDAETVLQQLELPYRVVELCSNDVSFSSSKTYDLEVWFPSQNTYREISSCSNFLDFQARRAMLRYRKETGEVAYLHTVNGSGLALGRTFAAILENCQTEDGKILIPKVLHKYLGEEKID